MIEDVGGVISGGITIIILLLFAIVMGQVKDKRCEEPVDETTVSLVEAVRSAITCPYDIVTVIY